MRPVKRRAWIGWLVLAAAILIGAAFAITSVLMDDSATASRDIVRTSTTPSPPKPISRAELMEEYAKIAPNDVTATPETIDDVAEQACDKLDKGHTTDELITAVNDMYRTNSTKVMRLLVSYGCPEYLADFK